MGGHGQRDKAEQHRCRLLKHKEMSSEIGQATEREELLFASIEYGKRRANEEQ